MAPPLPSPGAVKKEKKKQRPTLISVPVLAKKTSKAASTSSPPKKRGRPLKQKPDATTEGPQQAADGKPTTAKDAVAAQPKKDAAKSTKESALATAKVGSGVGKQTSKLAGPAAKSAQLKPAPVATAKSKNTRAEDKAQPRNQQLPSEEISKDPEPKDKSIAPSTSTEQAARPTFANALELSGGTSGAMKHKPTVTTKDIRKEAQNLAAKSRSPVVNNPGGSKQASAVETVTDSLLQLSTSSARAAATAKAAATIAKPRIAPPALPTKDKAKTGKQPVTSKYFTNNPIIRGKSTASTNDSGNVAKQTSAEVTAAKTPAITVQGSGLDKQAKNTAASPSTTVLPDKRRGRPPSPEAPVPAETTQEAPSVPKKPVEEHDASVAKDAEPAGDQTEDTTPRNDPTAPKKEKGKARVQAPPDNSGFTSTPTVDKGKAKAKDSLEITQFGAKGRATVLKETPPSVSTGTKKNKGKAKHAQSDIWAIPDDDYDDGKEQAPLRKKVKVVRSTPNTDSKNDSASVRRSERATPSKKAAVYADEPTDDELPEAPTETTAQAPDAEARPSAAPSAATPKNSLIVTLRSSRLEEVTPLKELRAIRKRRREEEERRSLTIETPPPGSIDDSHDSGGSSLRRSGRLRRTPVQFEMGVNSSPSSISSRRSAQRGTPSPSAPAARPALQDDGDDGTEDVDSDIESASTSDPEEDVDSNMESAAALDPAEADVDMEDEDDPVGYLDKANWTMHDGVSYFKGTPFDIMDEGVQHSLEAMGEDVQRICSRVFGVNKDHGFIPTKWVDETVVDSATGMPLYTGFPVLHKKQGAWELDADEKSFADLALEIQRKKKKKEEDTKMKGILELDLAAEFDPDVGGLV